MKLTKAMQICVDDLIWLLFEMKNCTQFCVSSHCSWKGYLILKMNSYFYIVLWCNIVNKIELIDGVQLFSNDFQIGYFYECNFYHCSFNILCSHIGCIFLLTFWFIVSLPFYYHWYGCMLDGFFVHHKCCFWWKFDKIYGA